MPAITGVYEYFFGANQREKDAVIAYFAELGFSPSATGVLTASEALARYGVSSAVEGFRLSHPGCASSDTGHVRLQIWDSPRDAGLGAAKPLEVGSRWMGSYTSNVLLLRDAFEDGAKAGEISATLSPIVRAPLDPSAPSGFFTRWVGLREMFVIAPLARHAFIQRNQLERPGFGTFNSSTPLPVTEGTHANIVQPSHDTAFYRDVFGLQSLGGVHTSGWENRATAGVLMLEDGQTFQVERMASPGQPTGFLQVYSPNWETPDNRARSAAGSLGLCQYSYRVDDLAGMRDRAATHGASHITQLTANEFGEPQCSFVAPDGIAWTLVG